MHDSVDLPSLLIVNADDFGHFRCVSRGILDAHRNGVVTATGIFANGLQFDRCLDDVRSATELDLGVHLNVTEGTALSAEMRSCLKHSGGRFSGKRSFVIAYLLGRIRRSDVESEWRAQIEKCLRHGLRIMFLNSHEHIHMLPPLFSLVQDLASDYGVPYIRTSTPDSAGIGHAPGFVRDSAMRLLDTINARRLTISAPYFLGMGASGRLDKAYLDQRLSSLVPGRVYELMCHPGYLDRTEIDRRDLLDYHDWELETKTLMSDTAHDLLRSRNIRLVRYRDLESYRGAAQLRDPGPDHPTMTV